MFGRIGAALRVSRAHAQRIGSFARTLKKRLRVNGGAQQMRMGEPCRLVADWTSVFHFHRMAGIEIYDTPVSDENGGHSISPDRHVVGVCKAALSGLARFWPFPSSGSSGLPNPRCHLPTRSVAYPFPSSKEAIVGLPGSMIKGVSPGRSIARVLRKAFSLLELGSSRIQSAIAVFWKSFLYLTFSLRLSPG